MQLRTRLQLLRTEAAGCVYLQWLTVAVEWQDMPTGVLPEPAQRTWQRGRPYARDNPSGTHK